ncbi:MAG: glycosyltransferase family 2 protein [Thermodesulfobacteriota bacterium]
MPTHMQISAIIPCLNEEKTLPVCIAKVQGAMASLGLAGEVVVGDNGSSDGSVATALGCGARVAHEDKVKGYGAAVKAAVKEANHEYLIMADADDSYDWQNLGPFVEKLREGYDFVIGNRFQGRIHAGAMPFLHRYLGNPLLSALARIFYRIPVGDFHCGMRAFTREAYRKMNLQTDGMEFATEMVVRAAQEGLRIAEVPIDLYPDKRSRPPHLRTFRDGWRHLRFIMTYAPNYLYMIPGAILFTLGAALQIVLANGPVAVGDFFMGPHFLALGLLLTLVGFNAMNLGLIAKVYLVKSAPAMRKKMVAWLQRYYSLERGLLFGGLLTAGGLLFDGILLYRWLRERGPMEESVHLAFVASGFIVIGINSIFGSFMLGMLLNDSMKEGK